MIASDCKKIESTYVNGFKTEYGFEPLLPFAAMRKMWNRFNGHYSITQLCDLMLLWFASGKGAWCGYKVTCFQSDFNELLVAYSSIPWDNYSESVYTQYCETCDEYKMEKKSYDEWRAGIIRERFASLHPSR